MPGKKDRLAKVEEAARKAASADKDLKIEILFAHRDGFSLRAIAAAADVSYETVRRIIQP